MRVLSLFVASLVASVSGHSFSSCQAGSPITVNTITLTPDSPVGGKPLNIEVSASSTKVLQKLSAHVEAKAFGIKVLSTDFDICSSITCPIAAGPVDIKISQDLPDGIPQGVTTDVQITLLDENSAQDGCVSMSLTFGSGSSLLRSQDNALYLYKLWVAQHGMTENSHHLKNFRSNFAKVSAHNKKHAAGHSTFKMSLNKFSHLSAEEFKEFMGLNAKVPVRSGIKSDIQAVGVPDSIDWSSKLISKDQKQCGSCFSFSCLGSIEGLYQIKYNKKVSLSEEEIVDCDTESNGFSSNGCSGGLMSDCLSYVEKNGISSDSVYKYTATDGTCRASKYPRVVKITSHTDIDSGDETSTKSALVKQPIAIAINAGDSLQSYESGYLTESDCSSEQSDLNHGVVLSGFMDYKDGQPVYKILNSWSNSWGENGFFYLTRNAQTSSNNPGTCGMFLMASYPNDVEDASNETIAEM